VSNAPAPLPVPQTSRKMAAVVGMAPLFPFVIAALIHAPLTDAAVVALDGVWRARAAEQPASVAVDTVVPGRLAVERPVLEKTFAIPDAPREPFLLVLGGFKGVVGDISVNGVWVGSEGVPATGYKLEQLSLSAYTIPVGLLVRGSNTVQVRFTPEGSVDDSPGGGSVVERRLLIGPLQIVRPWFDRVTVLERLLDLGGVFVLVFLSGLMLILARVEPDRTARRLQAIAAVLCLAIVVYLAGKSGLAVALGLTHGVIGKAVTVIAFSMVELLERALLGRISWVQRVNRFICMAHLVGLSFLSTTTIYATLMPYLFVMIIYGTAVAVRAAVRQRTRENLLFAGAILAMGVAGANDVLTDLNVVATPRLFTLAAVNIGIIAAIFVVSRFVRTMRDNAELLTSVEDKNRELEVALDRAEESTRLKSAFLANTSHELRTPLNSIINVPEGLLEEFVQKPFIACSACSSLFEAPDGYEASTDEACPECGARGTLATELRAVFSGDPDAAMRYLKAIQHSGRHLLAVVNDLLDFSKLEAGKMVVHMEDARLPDLLEKLDLAMTPIAQTRGVILEFPQDASLASLPLRTDPTKLMQVLMNLVSNAIKFSPEGSRVIVRSALSADRLVVSVVDEGIGIAPEDQARIFESFLQLDNSHTRKVGGTGLGLTISRKICELLGGSLSLQSAPGRGSTFEVSVPRESDGTVGSSVA
jgi:signal transduction histidine kinase